MKKFLVILSTVVMFLESSTLPFHAKTLPIPPIPKEHPRLEKTVIVTTPTTLTKMEIQQLLRPYPDIKLRYIYKNALQGFSAKGTIDSLSKLARSNRVELVSQVRTYQAELDGNIQIIGADRARSFFDGNKNRLTGRGVTIGVIDTGIDYRHPDLRRNYSGGFDLVDGDRDPMETPGEEGMSTLHGTHVAGIIAGNGKMHGVAPDAKIMAYRALGPGGAGTTEQVLAAIDKAIEDRVDILNLSLGNDINGPDLPISMALNNAVKKGITAVTSSGNAGPDLWTVGSPGTASLAISVGASTPPLQIPYAKIEGLEGKIRLNPMYGAKKWNFKRPFQLADGGLGKKKELIDIKGKIVLIERGGISFGEKAKNAYQAGAEGVIIYNNTNGSVWANLEELVPIPVSIISNKQGRKIKKLLKKTNPYIETVLVEEKDLLAEFSSRGPVTSSWEVKPDVVAPGVDINSTVPGGGYLALQGTSMAAPHVAGACALIKQAHPDWDPEKIKAALMNTAKPLLNKKGNLYRPFEQGAGRIQIEKAINTESIVMPGSIQFGKFYSGESFHVHKRELTIENVGNNSKRYSIKLPAKEEGIQWTVPLSFSLEPGEKRKVEISITVDPSSLKKKIYDGYLEIEAGFQKIFIPYLYVLEEPDYPRVMGFGFGIGDKKGTYRYEVYLPGGAEEFGIALFDPDTYRFIRFLDIKRNVEKGVLKEEIEESRLPKEGFYIAKVFAKKAGKEDMVEAGIYILEEYKN